MKVKEYTTLQHLPPAPQGYVYRGRSFVEKDADDKEKPGVWGSYTTTGLFPAGAPNGRGANLAAIPTLYIDADLCDFVLRDQVLDDDAYKAARKDAKKALHALPQDRLQALIRQLYSYGLQIIQSVAGSVCTVAVASGYGVHFYLHLHEPFDALQQLDRIRALQARLVSGCNARAYDNFADKGVKDAGTRVLRMPGSENRKGPTPRPIVLLAAQGPVYTLAWLDQTLPLAATPAARPAASTAGAGQLPRAVVADADDASGFDALFNKAQERTQETLSVMFAECPFFQWAAENPGAVGLRSWYGAATQIAAVAGEDGRAAYHEFSALDPDRYDEEQTDKFYSYALDHIRGGQGPWLYTTLAENGDWPGKPPKGYKAPAVLGAFKAQGPRLSAKAEQCDLLLDKDGRVVKCYTNLRRILRGADLYGARLRHNLMTGAPDYDGDPCTDAFTGDVQETLQTEFGVGFAADQVRQAVNEIAWANRFHPVEEYLRALPQWDGIDRIAQILPALQAQPRPLYQQYIRCFFIGAVRRGLLELRTGESAEATGVKVDTTLILQGRQGGLKSTFFNELAGEWFSDTPIDIGHKDAYMQLQRSWILEWSEFEQTYGRNIIATKAFLSAKRDIWRPPYGHYVVDRPRRTVIVGTTNETHFLYDATGDRRHHVIPIGERIDLQFVRANRAQLWAQAMHLHAQGQPHWLDDAHDQQRATDNEDYRLEEPWESLIGRWIKDRAAVTVEMVLQQAVQKPQDRWRHADAQEVGRILRKRGFDRKRTTIDGERQYVFVLPHCGDIAAELNRVPSLLASPPQPQAQPGKMPAFDAERTL